MKKTPITGKRIPTAKRGDTPHNERRASAHPPTPPRTVADGWVQYAPHLESAFANLAPAQLAEAVFYAGAALGLVLTMHAIDAAPDLQTAHRRILAIRDEIERYAQSLEDPPHLDP